MNISYYDYEELAAKALETNATADLEALGEWFNQYGRDYWNGECYTIDSSHDLFPIYEEVEEDDFQIVGYEIR